MTQPARWDGLREPSPAQSVAIAMAREDLQQMGIDFWFDALHPSQRAKYEKMAAAAFEAIKVEADGDLAVIDAMDRLAATVAPQYRHG